MLPLYVALQAYWAARYHRFKRDLATLPDGVEAIVLPTGQKPSLRFNDFTKSAELIRVAHMATEQFLDGTVSEDEPLPAGDRPVEPATGEHGADRKSTRLNSSH